MASAGRRRGNFPLGNLRHLVRDIVSSLVLVAEDVCLYADVRGDQANARRTWTVTLATLGAEAAESAALLADAGNLRMALTLVRSLYEYGNKVTHYANNIEEAVSDARQGFAFRQRMVEVALSDFTPTIEPLSRETKVRHTNISQVVDGIAKRGTPENSDGGDRFKRHFHDGFYAYASAISHGSQGAINEVFRIEEDGGEIAIWARKRPDRLKVIAFSQVALQGWILLFALTKFSPVNHRINTDALMERWKAFDKPLLSFKADLMSEVGFEQATLDCLGT